MQETKDMRNEAPISHFQEEELSIFPFFNLLLLFNA